MEYSHPDNFELGLYDCQVPLYRYHRNLDTISSSHLPGSAALQGFDAGCFDFSFAAMPYDYVHPLPLEEFGCPQPGFDFGTINPQALHEPVAVSFEPPRNEDSLYDYAAPTPELVTTPQPIPASPSPIAPPENLDEFLIPAVDPIPMKKDRQRGSANLLRSACDPDRHHQCTMCIRKFKRRADLARHIKRHQGIRPYHCTAKCCPLAPSERAFFRADARQRHWKAHPECEAEFYLTDAGREWMKRNRNRSQKFRGMHSRHTSRSTSYDDDDDEDYHD